MKPLTRWQPYAQKRGRWWPKSRRRSRTATVNFSTACTSRKRISDRRARVRREHQARADHMALEGLARPRQASHPGRATGRRQVNHRPQDCGSGFIRRQVARWHKGEARQRHHMERRVKPRLSPPQPYPSSVLPSTRLQNSLHLMCRSHPELQKRRNPTPAPLRAQSHRTNSIPRHPSVSASSSPLTLYHAHPMKRRSSSCASPIVPM